MRRSLGILYFLFIVYYLLMMANGIVIEKGSPVVLGFNILFFAYMVFLNLFKNRYFNKFLIIYLFLLFLLVLILLTSSAYYESLRLFVKYAIALLAFPAGFNLITREKDYHYLMRVAFAFLVLYLLNYIIASTFHLGGSNLRYKGETSVETGNLFDDALFLNVCILTLLPLMFYFYRKGGKRFVIILMVLVVTVISVICMKRMVIVCVVLSLVMISLLTRWISHKYGKLPDSGSVLKLSLPHYALISVALIVIGVLFWDTFMDQLEARRTEIQRSLEEESRVAEIIAIYEDMSEFESDGVSLLGQETFHTVGTYANGAFGDRMIHTNFGIILNGSGFIGLLFYLVLSLYFLVVLFRTVRNSVLTENLFARKLYVTYLVLWTVYNVASFSGTIWLTMYPAFNFLIMGAILRFFYDDKVSNLKSKYERIGL